MPAAPCLQASAKAPVQETPNRRQPSLCLQHTCQPPCLQHLSTLRSAKPAGPKTLNPALPCTPRPQGSTTLRMLTAEMAPYRDRQDIPLKWGSAILEVRALLFRV